MADIILKVSTEDVREKANQISMQRAVMETIMSDLQGKINQLQEYFKSEAGEAYTQQYTNVSKNIQGSLDGLMKHVSNLQEAANVHDRGMSDNKAKAQSLSGESIFK